MKVTKVIIEGFHNILRKEYSFKDMNYLYGRNGAGKSSVLQALQLGLLGYVPGTNKTKQGVFTHANGRSMAIKVLLDDNGNQVSIQRIWTLSKNSVSEEIQIQPDGYDIKNLIEELELPLFNFDEFTHMTANSLKDWFINYLPKADFQTDWKKELLEAASELPEASIDNDLVDNSVEAIEDLGLRGVEEIRAANSYFKNQQTFMKQELTRKTSTIQSLIHYDDYEATYPESELKALISQTEDAIVKATVAKQNADRIKKLKAEFAGLKDASGLIASTEENLKKLVEDAEEIAKSQKIKETAYMEMCSEVKSYQKIIDSQGVCPYTQQSCISITNLRDSYVERQKELSIQIDELQNELTEMQKRRSALEGQINVFKTQLISLQNDTRRYEQLKAELESLPAVDSSLDLSTLQFNLDVYKEQYGKAVANRQYTELSSVVLQDKYRIENSLECLKLWTKLTDVNGLQAKCGDVNPFEQLAKHIDDVLIKIFPSPVSCKFNSDAGKANSFSFGLVRDDVYIPYVLLSSGEKCMFILSMYIGLLNYTRSPLKLILVDDFLDHLDDDNFASLFKVLHDNTDIQYIFAGVKPVNDESCNVIHLS